MRFRFACETRLLVVEKSSLVKRDKCTESPRHFESPGILKVEGIQFCRVLLQEAVNDRVQGIQLFEGILEFLDRVSKTVVRVKRVWN